MNDRQPPHPRAALAAWRGLADRRRRVDLALAGVGAAFGAVSLALPFGRDQGLYFFVGREWLRHGELPYRDMLEQKTPGIYFLHALAIALFGEHVWSIRVLELGCVVALGLVCARLATPRAESVPPGLYGVSVLAAAVLYIGMFNFWDTAQCEIWCTTAALGSACAVQRMRRETWAPAVGGLLGGLALVLKPPGAALVALAGLGAISRAVRASEPVRASRARAGAKAALVFGAFAALPGVLLVAYFAAKGALPAMIDVLVGANSYYVRHERGVQTVLDIARRTHDVYKLWEPISALLLEALVAGLAVGVVRRDAALRDRHALALAACLAAFAGVLVQLKFYMYHWGLVVGPAVLVASNVALDAIALARWLRPGKSEVLAPSLFAANLLLAFALTGPSANTWLEETTATLDYLGGRIDRDEFSRHFSVGLLGFRDHDAEQVGRWLSDHTAPDDEVAVRGFEPEIYAIAHRRYGGRFFWTAFLTDPRRAYRREEWLAQDRHDLVTHAPRWIVALANVHEGPDSPAYFAPLGYVVRQNIDGFAIMEKADALGAR